MPGVSYAKYNLTSRAVGRGRWTAHSPPRTHLAVNTLVPESVDLAPIRSRLGVRRRLGPRTQQLVLAELADRSRPRFERVRRRHRRRFLRLASARHNIIARWSAHLLALLAHHQGSRRTEVRKMDQQQQVDGVQGRGWRYSRHPGTWKSPKRRAWRPDDVALDWVLAWPPPAASIRNSIDISISIVNVRHADDHLSLNEADALPLHSRLSPTHPNPQLTRPQRWHPIRLCPSSLTTVPAYVSRVAKLTPVRQVWLGREQLP